jgi:hypothetical protein
VGDVLLLLPVKVGDEVAVQVFVAAAGHGAGQSSRASMAGWRDRRREPAQAEREGG